MLLEKTHQIFNLKTVAGSPKMTHSKSSGLKEKCLQAQLRWFAQKGVTSRTEYDNYCDVIALEKEVDNREDNDGKSD